MAQKIKQANIFGRLGSALGQGLAESIPKEANRMRLSQGLMDLSKEKDLEPLQFMSKFYGIPEVANNPQLVQSGTQLYNQSRRNQAFQGQFDPRTEALIKENEVSKQKENAGINRSPSLVEEERQRKTLEGNIPSSLRERQKIATERFNRNPGKYRNDIDNAINEVDREQEINQQKAQAESNLLSTQTAIEDKLKSDLQARQTKLNARLPGNVYTNLENETIDLVKKGYLPQQAVNDIGNKMYKIGEEYAKVQSMGNLSNILNGKENLKSIDNLQKEFAERGDTKNLAEELIANLEVTPKFAYSKAQPINTNKQLYKAVKNLPKPFSLSQTLSDPKIIEATEKAMDELFPLMSREDSPLALKSELMKKSYNEDVIDAYFKKNRDKLTPEQARQLSLPETKWQALNDAMLMIWGG